MNNLTELYTFEGRSDLGIKEIDIWAYSYADLYNEIEERKGYDFLGFDLIERSFLDYIGVDYDEYAERLNENEFEIFNEKFHSTFKSHEEREAFYKNVFENATGPAYRELNTYYIVDNVPDAEMFDLSDFGADYIHGHTVIEDLEAYEDIREFDRIISILDSILLDVKDLQVDEYGDYKKLVDLYFKNDKTEFMELLKQLGGELND
ncbi:hypothetical protein [Abyssicoccus albus]|uniref:Uncharacterized protein n=1 Tax=Abyssicoccus albus TaxID=1817405 RepID=A0A3N5C8F9_9BACL|nr:hypothetical protein [Abyssicoccus albus]RPF54745.1 hypothetical protein EDD62_1705 [Abyssicoccus albus]